MRKMKRSLVFIMIMLITMANNVFSGMPAYNIFDKDGSREDFDELAGDALYADIIFFGELHNNPICHWLQLELTKYMYQESKANNFELILGAEMFETDDQIVLDDRP